MPGARQTIHSMLQEDSNGIIDSPHRPGYPWIDAGYSQRKILSQKGLRCHTQASVPAGAKEPIAAGCQIRRMEHLSYSQVRAVYGVNKRN